MVSVAGSAARSAIVRIHLQIGAISFVFTTGLREVLMFAQAGTDAAVIQARGGWSAGVQIRLAIGIDATGIRSGHAGSIAAAETVRAVGRIQSTGVVALADAQLAGAGRTGACARVGAADCIPGHAESRILPGRTGTALRSAIGALENRLARSRECTGIANALTGLALLRIADSDALIVVAARALGNTLALAVAGGATLLSRAAIGATGVRAGIARLAGTTIAVVIAT